MDLAAVRPLPRHVAHALPWRQRVAAVGLAIAGGAVATQTAAHLLNAFALGNRYPGLDAATEGNGFAWAASLATLAAATAALAVALGARRPPVAAAVLVLLTTFLAIDDMVDLHDELAGDVAADLPGRLARMGDWAMPLVYLPILATAFVLLVRVALTAPGVAARPLALGLGLLALAVVLRLAAAGIRLEGETLTSDLSALGVAVQQGAELGGWILVATGLAASVGAVGTSDRLPTNRRRSPRSELTDRA